MVDGLVRVKPLVKRVVELGMPAVGLTEQSNMCSLVRFYKATTGAGVKPIIGADLWLENPDEPESPYSGPVKLQMSDIKIHDNCYTLAE
jgi:DNA polymerase-3 subunit alpha